MKRWYFCLVLAAFVVVIVHISPSTESFSSDIKNTATMLIAKTGVGVFLSSVVYYFLCLISLTVLYVSVSKIPKLFKNSTPTKKAITYPTFQIKTSRGVQGVEIRGRSHKKFLVYYPKSKQCFRRTKETLIRLCKKQDVLRLQEQLG